MRLCRILFVLSILVLIPSCSSESVENENGPEAVGKPRLASIKPAGVKFNGCGFRLQTLTDPGAYYDDKKFALYINHHRVSTASPDARGELYWTIRPDLLQGFLDAGFTQVEVHLTNLVSRDVSDCFNDYAEYMSLPQTFDIAPAATDFSQPFRFVDNLTLDPILRIDQQGGLFLAWQEKTADTWLLLFSKSIDWGATWSTPEAISQPGMSVDSKDLAVSPEGDVFVLWTLRDESPQRLYFSRALDSGAWIAPKTLDVPSGYNFTIPRITAASGGYLYAAWSYFLPDGECNCNTQRIEIYTSPDWGESWDKTLTLEGDENTLGDPDMTSGNDGSVHLFSGFKGIDNGQYIYCISCHSSRDNGQTWQVSRGIVGYSDLDPRRMRVKSGDDNTLFLTWNTEIGGRMSVAWNHFFSFDFIRGEWAGYRQMDDILKLDGSVSGMVIRNKEVDLVSGIPSSGPVASSFLPPSLVLLHSNDSGISWDYPEFIPGVGSATDPSMAINSAGRVFLVYVADRDYTNEGAGALYLVSWNR